jgi:hypothetical protein
LRDEGETGMPDAVVAIPVYKPAPDRLEALSLARCAAVLGRHPVVFFGPRSLDYAAYRAAVPGATVAGFADRFFRSLAGYSELLVTPAFYEAFAGYDFLLLYQLDAFVFADNLLAWCERGYDYIGAPWQDEVGQWKGVGNGGFSLRKVGPCLEVLRSQRKVDPGVLWAHVRRTTPSPLIRALKYHRKVLAHLGIASDVRWFLRKWVRRGEPEDMFWGLHAVRYHPAFRVAPVEEALRFAVEGGLEEACRHYRELPPFGCHRSWFLEMIERYQSAAQGPQSAYEGLVWDLARVAGLPRG